MVVLSPHSLLHSEIRYLLVNSGYYHDITYITTKPRFITNVAEENILEISSDKLKEQEENFALSVYKAYINGDIYQLEVINSLSDNKLILFLLI